MTERGGGERFRRADRLRSSKDFQRVSREGTRVTSRSFVVLLADPPHGAAVGYARLGLTVSRRIGSAVVRNRVKRRIREWFRRGRNVIPEGKDLVVIARGGAGSISLAELEAELTGALGRFSRAGSRR